MFQLKTNIYLLLWFCFIATFAFLIPYYSNDYRYQLIEGTEELVTSFYDICVSQYRHYFTWGGRTPPHFLAQCLLWGGKIVSSLATALCYVLLIYFIYSMGTGKKLSPFKMPFVPVVFISIGLWVCMRSYGEVVFMLVTSCNYLFTSTFIMLYLLPYRFALNEERTEHGILFALMMFVLGIIAGWCNENTGFAICAVTGLLCLYKLHKRELTLWQATGLIGMGIGFLVLALSPGNAARYDSMAQNNFDYFPHLLNTIQIFFVSIIENLPVILCYVYFLVLFKRNNLKEKCQTELYASYYSFALGFVSLAIMIFSPNFPGRSAAPFTMFVLASDIALYAALKKHNINPLKSAYKMTIYALFFVFFAVTSTNAFGALFQARADQVELEKSIADQIAQGKKDLEVPIMHVQSGRYIFIGAMKVSKENFANKIAARYYHVNSFTKACDLTQSFIHFDLKYVVRYGEPVCRTH
ncbi:DUF3329 domain-containing protein [Succinivibrio dextrinosolvens]|uniref:Glucosyl transferase GtrII n=1 Tax=Succinivibrio dextrinosolvens TaxID=83771 RepID=A0A662Z6N7_9GAMM|nr:DUF6056 family protein [Succinivibrio dextrinosolvens]SFJ82406.1 hypothetical protein SAMN04487865_100375 [Succinivibrio dextrinosolvens]